MADGNTDAQGSRAAGSPVTVTYTVTNSGTDALSLSTATSSAASNVVVGTISAPGSSSVAAGGGSTTFTVQYTPTVAGAFSFDLAMVNGDADESPYNITVSGTATGAPEISVSSSVSGAVADSGTDAQGSRAAGSPVTVTYTVTNSGTDALSLSTATSSSASNVVVGSISAPGSSSVAAGGGSTTFTVQYTPTVAGAFSFDLAPWSMATAMRAPTTSPSPARPPAHQRSVSVPRSRVPSRMAGRTPRAAVQPVARSR